MLLVSNHVDIKEFKNKVLDNRKLAGEIYMDECSREIQLTADHYYEIDEEVLDFLYESIKSDIITMVKKEKK